jgi:Flp pilus assembly protein TadD
LKRALQLNNHLTSAHFELALVYQRDGKFPEALTEADAALKSSPNNQPLHYLRGQILKRLGRTEEAQAEMKTASELYEQSLTKRQREFESGPLPNPEVNREPQ